MVEAHEKSREFLSLEDYIEFGKHDGDVHLSISLKKKIMPHHVAMAPDNLAGERDMYGLTANFILTADGTIRTIEKILVTGSILESSIASSGKKDIANQRLYGEYEQLRDANIEFEEKYF